MAGSDREKEPWKRIVDSGRDAARRVSERVLEPIQRAVSGVAIQPNADANLDAAAPEPPVVARLIVEIRSDGSRTIARGGLEDAITGQKVAIRADGTSPAQLARSLASTLLSLPLFTARIARSLKQRTAGDETKPGDE